MQAQGFKSLFDMERLSVMGLWEPLKRLPELLSIRRSIIKRYSVNKPTVFIGIDSPDNAKIEQKLHSAGVKLCIMSALRLGLAAGANQKY